jgi:hypothetical protein
MFFRYSLIVLLTLVNLSACAVAPARDVPAGPKASTITAPFWAERNLAAAERFELAKRSQPGLIAFLRRMPKGADLHNHVSGAAYSDYLLDAAATNKLNYNVMTNLFTRERPTPGEIITIEDLKAQPERLAGYLDAFSMRGWYANTNNGHDHFFDAFPRLKSADANTNAQLVEVIERNLYQNVQYLELMTSVVPPELTQKFIARLSDFNLHDLEGAYRALQPLINDTRTHDAIRKYLDERDRYIKTHLSAEALAAISGDDPALVVRYMPQLHRNDSPEQFFARAVVFIVAMRNDARVVGLNLVGAEDDPRARAAFSGQMDMLDFLWNRMQHPRFALHAGELVLRESPVEPMRDRIRRSIERGHALRIGHGISVAWDDDVIGLLASMREQGILVEICLSSNESILGVQGDAHPFQLYRSAGVPVSLNTDDEGVSRSNLTMEYVKAVERYGLRYPEVQELARNSIEYAFLPGESLYRQHDYASLRNGFESVRAANWRPAPAAQALMRENEKLRLQVRLERSMVEFESNLAAGFTRSH